MVTATISFFGGGDARPVATTKAGLLSAVAALGLASVSAPAAAQDESREDGYDPVREEIVVNAGRYRGQVDAPQPPIVELDEEQIASYGAGSLAELLEALAPQTGSGRGRGGGRPVVLVNGQRVSGFRELRHYPPEAVRKVEVLPEEVALRFGYSADQRVVNFILKDDFASREIEVEYNQPWAGGNSGSEVELTWLTIDGPDRLNVNLELNDTSLLTERERGVVQPERDTPDISSDPDPAAYRSLVADSASVELDATWTTGLSDNGGSLSFNGNVTREDNLTLRGLDTVLLVAPDASQRVRALGADNPLTRDSRTTTYALASTLNMPIGAWQLDATFDGSHARTRTRVDRRADTSQLQALAAEGALAIDGPLPLVADAGQDLARSRVTDASALVTLSGRPLLLPAGDVSTTFDFGYSLDRIQSDDTRNPGVQTDLKRGDIGAGINIAIPLASRRENALAAIGDLSLNVGAGIDRLSDFGTLTDWTAGLNWKPLPGLALQASYIVRDAAPSLGDLGAPEILLVNEPIYDFNLGQTVLATVLSGGNPNLSAETQRDIKLGATWDLPFLDGSTLVMEYFRNRSDDVTSAFPLLTPGIEAAFSDRVTRDGGGALLAIDRRPVTFAKRSTDKLAFGLDLRGKLGAAPSEGERGPGERDGRPSVRSAFRGGGEQGRWSLSVNHTINLKDEALIASDGPLLDLLDGDALSDGGNPRHEISLDGGAYWKGIGFRLSAEYESGTRINGSGLPGSSDLRFDDLAKIDLRVFVDLGRRKALAELSPIFEDMRLFLRLDNIFDAQQRVTDNSGMVPLSYQPALIDPVGRYFEIELRKVF